MIEERKAEHIRICLEEDVLASHNWWDHVHFIHEALPEIDFDSIDTSCELFGRKLKMPVVIAAMTGGYKWAEEINGNLAKASSEVGAALGIGSQRAGLENPELESTYSVVKDHDVPLVIGNIGAPQLIKQGSKKAYGVEDCRKAMEMIDAQVLAVHLNFLQEACQPNGDKQAKGCLNAIAKISSELPVIVKETGAGISTPTMERLTKTNIIGIDVGGLGGTSFSAVEMYRVPEDHELRRVGGTFRDWGIPTPISLVIAREEFDVIATGGIRHGLDVARAVALGASSAGLAGPLVKAATTSAEAVVAELRTIERELKTAMFLTGSTDLAGLTGQPIVMDDRLEGWIELVR